MKSSSRYLVILSIFSLIFIYLMAKYLFQQRTDVRVWFKSLQTLSESENDGHYEGKGLHVDNELGWNTLLPRLKTDHNSLPQIVVAVVACGDRLAEALVMIKSAIVFTRSPLKFIVLADDFLIPSFMEKILSQGGYPRSKVRGKTTIGLVHIERNKWQVERRKIITTTRQRNNELFLCSAQCALHEWRITTNYSFVFDVLPITFPLQGNPDEWRRLFKPCASQRLFLPVVLADIDSLLYVDTDTLFLGPLEDVWHHFELMNSTQIAALTPEHEDPNTGWYNRFARHPYYGKLGVNSGVMLMNLTRMRLFSWTDYVVPIYKEYKLTMTWGDQDIINIIFHFHPDKLYVYPCRYNYRPDHCMYMSVCHGAEQLGVAVLHGSRGSFHAEKLPAFRAIFKATEEYQLGTDPYSNLYLPMRNYLDFTAATNCGKVRHIFLKKMQSYFQKPKKR